jgi:ribose 5-phosphate isomerase A
MYVVPLLPARGKEAAASSLAERLIRVLKPGQSLGVGTGSTVKLVIDYLVSGSTGKRLLSALNVYASSLDTALLLEEHGVAVSLTLPPHPLDLYFDGADEVAAVAGMCQVLKGRGAAMTREKVLAHFSRESMLVIDESKLSRNLGEQGKPVPVEVLPVALHPVAKLLESYGVRVEVRRCDCRDGPALADNGGAVLDTWPWGRLEPLRYEGILDSTPGVIGHGLFIGYFNEVVVGYEDGSTRTLSCKRTRGWGIGRH